MSALVLTGQAGPVLEAGETARAVVDAIFAENAQAVLVDRGSYWRVLVPGRCAVSRRAIETRLGRPFALPGDLERIMPSFKGRLVVSDEGIVWSCT